MKKFLPRTKNNTSGFTLIELLVVISIIAFLSVIGIAAYTSTQKNARDARRRADIEAIGSALETTYNSTDGIYRTLAVGDFSTGKVPTDPDNTGTYVYTVASTTTVPADYTGITPATITSTAATITTNSKAYVACAQLETAGQGNSSDYKGTSGTGFYCLRNRQ